MNKALKQEAIRRMKKLHLLEEVIEDFENSELIYKSEQIGILVYLEDEELKLVSDFEKKYSNNQMKIYHVIKRYTDHGVAYTYLYVTIHDLEPYYQHDFDLRLKDNAIFTYFDAYQTGYFSEHGTEYCIASFGGLMIPHVPNIEAYKNLRKFW